MQAQCCHTFGLDVAYSLLCVIVTLSNTYWAVVGCSIRTTAMVAELASDACPSGRFVSLSHMAVANLCPLCGEAQVHTRAVPPSPFPCTRCVLSCKSAVTTESPTLPACTGVRGRLTFNTHTIMVIIRPTPAPSQPLKNGLHIKVW